MQVLEEFDIAGSPKLREAFRPRFRCLQPSKSCPRCENGSSIVTLLRAGDVMVAEATVEQPEASNTSIVSQRAIVRLSTQRQPPLRRALRAERHRQMHQH